MNFQITYSVTLKVGNTETSVPPVTTPAATDDNNEISTSSVASLSS